MSHHLSGNWRDGPPSLEFLTVASVFNTHDSVFAGHVRWSQSALLGPKRSLHPSTIHTILPHAIRAVCPEAASLQQSAQCADPSNMVAHGCTRHTEYGVMRGSWEVNSRHQGCGTQCAHLP